jgi:hypothetical protein
VKPTPTGKVVPATPSNNPKMISCVKLVENPTATAGTAENTSRSDITFLPPNLSASIPANNRPIDPSSTGTAIITLFCVADRL